MLHEIAMGTRERPNLSALFAPRSIAVLGASDNPRKLGGQVVQRLGATFEGALYPIHRDKASIAGLAAFASLAELPSDVDMLVALVPGRELVEAVESCPPGKVRFLVAIPSGFGEIPGEGLELQRALGREAARAGMRVVGPNCAGLINGIRTLNASIIPFLPPGGPGISVVTQSGGFGMALAMYCADSGLKLAKFCDIGNTLDLGMPEMLHYLGSDRDTTTIGIFLESVSDPQSFGEALRKLAQEKPVLLACVGRTRAGERASFAHLGIEPRFRAVRALVPRSVFLAETGLDLLHALKARSLTPGGSRGARLGIVTGTGGLGTEMADLADEHGLVVPEFSGELRARLQSHLPSHAAFGNPVDLTPAWWDYPSIYPRVVRDLADSGEIDMVLCSITDVATTLPELSANLARLATAIDLPVVAVWGSRDEDATGLATLQAAGVPCYRSTREAVRAAASLAQDHRRRT